MRKYILSLTVLCAVACIAIGQNKIQNVSLKNQSDVNVSLSSTRLLLIDENPLLVKEPGILGVQKLDSIVKYNFNQATNAWDKKHRKETFYYDSNYNEVNYSYSSWSNADNKWNDLWKEEFKYDENGNQIEFISYSMGKNGKIPFYKFEYTYNDKDEMVKTNYHLWSKQKNDWDHSAKVITSYNENSKILRDSIVVWNISSAQWEPSELIEYEYRAENIIVRNNIFIHDVYISEWDKNTEEWIYTDRVFYNTGYERYSIYRYNWMNESNKWEINQLSAHEYDEDHNMISVRTTSDIGTWKPNNISYNRYSYDYNLGYSELVLPNQIRNSYKRFYHHKITKKEIHRKEDVTDIKTSEDIYYYSPLGTTNTIDLNVQQVKVYPNPMDKVLYISASKKDFEYAMIYNITGSIVRSIILIDGLNTINVSELNKGIYLLKLKGKNKDAVTKRIIKK